MKGKQEIMSIIVTDRWEVDVRYKWNNKLLLSLIWSLSIAENWLRKRYLSVHTVWDSFHEWKISWNDSNNEYIEKELNKVDALNFYLDKRQILEDRMTAIAESDKSMKFKVNEKLFSNL